MRRQFPCLLTAVWFALAASTSKAADIRISDSPFYSIILEGKIVAGDYERFRKLIEDKCPSKAWSTDCPYEVYLASPGGSIVEAMRIGSLVRTLRLGTQVPEDAPADLRQQNIKGLKLQDPKNYLCASACFFVALAGIDRLPLAGTSRAILGVHRPFITDADLKALSANQTMVSAAQARSVVEGYLREMGVPMKYADLMFSIPKEELRWITQAEWEADFAGTIVELRDWLGARCDRRTDVEKLAAKVLDRKIADGERLSAEEEGMKRALWKQVEARVDCETSLKEKVREDAWKAYVSR